MKILGISATTHDSGVALIKDGKIIDAVNEERFSRKKMHSGFPHQTYEYITKKSDFNLIALCDYGHKGFINKSSYLAFNKSLFTPNPYISAKSNLMMTRWVLKTYFMFKKEQEEIYKVIKDHKDKVYHVEHHNAHAASAYFCSGMKKAMIVTMDNHGDLLTATVSVADNGKIERVDEIKWPHSPGFFYEIITKMLGFKPGRHEGKITGLAAYGKIREDLVEKIGKLMWYENGTIKTKAMIGSRGMVGSLTKKYSREDLAAVFQFILEDVVTKYVKYWKDKTGLKNIALAGGIFANVKLNQRIKELGFEEIFIFPHMGDGGTGAGAALYLAMKQENIKPYKLDNAYFGPSYTDKEIERELKESKLQYTKIEKNIEGSIAELIAKEKVIAHFDGRMEFGPRALGNRSILYQATDKSVNDWLNKRLERTEFMPFAPVTPERFANKCYKNLKGCEYAAQFMTITFDCTDQMKADSPAVVHVDGTARPQLTNSKINPRYNKIVEEYHKITKIPSIVNTSFNMHEEPIVCSPYDAIRSFKMGHLDYLAIGNFLVKNK